MQVEAAQPLNKCVFNHKLSLFYRPVFPISVLEIMLMRFSVLRAVKVLL